MDLCFIDFPFILTGFLYSIPKIKSKLSKASESRKSLNVEVDVFSAVTAEKKTDPLFS
ncbi:MAG: hypothetical protein IPI50_01110 [Saprospiraceae bacterium]|nr:hypothetical protein [Saprospiraceae bacterium]